MRYTDRKTQRRRRNTEETRAMRYTEQKDTEKRRKQKRHAP